MTEHERDTTGLFIKTFKVIFNIQHLLAENTDTTNLQVIFLSYYSKLNKSVFQ